MAAKNPLANKLGLRRSSPEDVTPYRKDRAVDKEWADIADALRSEPGTWFMVKEMPRTTASQTARAFNRGERKGFLLDEWEAKALPVSAEKTELYLRYIGS